MRRTRSFTLAAVAVFTAAVLAAACTPPPPEDPGSTTTTAPGSSTTTSSTTSSTTTSTTTTSTTSTTSTTVPTGAHVPAELVSIAPQGEAPLGNPGDVPNVSANGRYVSFQREATCGPVLRDRIAGTSTTFFAGQSGNNCPVSKGSLGISANGQRLLIEKAAAQCPATVTPTYTPAVFALSVIDVASGSFIDPASCTDPMYYSAAGQGFYSNSSVAMPTSAASYGALTGALLSGDGNSVVVLRRLYDWNYGVLPTVTTCNGPGTAPTTCYGVTSYRQRTVVDRLPVAGGTPVRLASLTDTGVVATPTGLAMGPFGGTPNVTLAQTDTSGTIVTVLTDVALTGGDTNAKADGYVIDGATGSFAPVATTTDGSITGDLSANGRYLLFSTAASNLVAGDTNGYADLFLLDRQTGAIERQSVGAASAQSNRATTARSSAVSDDGRFVAFVTDASTLGCAGNYATYYVRDRANGRTRAPFIRPSGAPATVGGSQGSAFSYEFQAQSSTLRLAGDGSSVLAVSGDWLGATAADPGVIATRVWAQPTVQSVPDC